MFGLFDLISAPPLSLSQIGYAIVLLCLVCFAGSLYLGLGERAKRERSVSPLLRKQTLRLGPVSIISVFAGMEWSCNTGEG